MLTSHPPSPFWEGQQLTKRKWNLILVRVFLDECSRITRQRDRRFFLGLIAPLQDSNISVDRERLGRIFQADLTRTLEQLLVHIRVGLQLDALVGVVFQLNFNFAVFFISDLQR